MPDEHAPDVWAVNRTTRIAVLESGAEIPVTHWFRLVDGDEEECEPELATRAVAGPLPWPTSPSGEKWYSIDLRDFCAPSESRCRN